MFESIEREIDGAIEAHMSWKEHLEDAIKNKSSDLSVDSVKSDQNCAFGLWIYSDDISEETRTSIERSSIPSLHHAFHNCAASLLEFALESKPRGDAEYMLLLSAY